MSIIYLTKPHIFIQTRNLLDVVFLECPVQGHYMGRMVISTLYNGKSDIL